MSNLIFNLRIWCIHFQVNKGVKIIPLLKWYDMWIGIYVDHVKQRYFVFIFPMIGIEIHGIWIAWNNSYSLFKNPRHFIHLFQFGKKHWDMKNYKREQ